MGGSGGRLRGWRPSLLGEFLFDLWSGFNVPTTNPWHCSPELPLSLHAHLSLAEFHQKREEYATDIENYLDLVNQMKKMQLEHESKVASLTKEKEGMEASMEEISNNIERLKSVIGKQELTVDDVRKMERHKLRLEEMCAQKKSVLDGHLNAIKEAEEKYAKCMELLNAAVEEYNSKARGLELIPETAKNAHGRKVEITVNANAHTMQGLLGVDIDAVVDHVKKVGDGYVRKMKDEKSRARELKERIDALEAESEELDQVIEVSLSAMMHIVLTLLHLF